MLLARLCRHQHQCVIAFRRSLTVTGANPAVRVTTRRARNPKPHNQHINTNTSMSSLSSPPATAAAYTSATATATDTPTTNTTTAHANDGKEASPQTQRPKFRIALVQLHVTEDKAQNVARAVEMIGRAVKEGQADLVVLPECFNSPYGEAYFDTYAEPIDASETLDAIAAAARNHGVTVVAGSIPTRDTTGQAKRADGSPALHNTSVTFDSEGQRIATYHKVHLFDVDIPGGITFFESNSLAPGNALTTFETSKQAALSGVRFGVGICFDVRFPELWRLYTDMGCEILLCPAAFNTTTGPKHWELLARARAVDNQAYMIMCSPSRVEGASYQAWGHSMVVDPWGKVLCEAAEAEEIVYADIDLATVDTFRQQIPTIANKREDMYDVVLKAKCEVNGRPML